jgi:hypothetical protein
MTQLIQYAVRVKGTQKYLPRPQRRDGRGGSHLEPVDFSDPDSWPKGYERDMLIRTYATRSAAQNLLNAWLQGKFYGDEYGDVWTTKQKHRRAEDMEVVMLTLHLPSERISHEPNA